MRRILVTHARERKAVKRGGGQAKLLFDDAICLPGRVDVDLVALDDAVAGLAKTDPPQARIVETNFKTRFLSGLSRRGGHSGGEWLRFAVRWEPSTAWKPHPRNVKKPSLGKWFFQDGMIVGGQDPPRVGSYLVTERTYADFELEIEVRPDWPSKRCT